MDPIATTVTLIGGISALIGLVTKAKRIWNRSDRLLWRRYLKAVTQSYQDPQSRTRFAYSSVAGAIPLECTKNREPAALGLVTLLANAAVSASAPKPLLVLGEYGQGKTVACGDLANRLAIYSREHRKAQHIPILVRLQDNPDFQNIDSSCSRSIQTLYNIKVDESAIKRAATQGRLVYILDGADESLSNADPDEAYISLRKLAEQVAFRSNALVVTSRPNIMTAAHFRRLQESFDIVNITFPRLSQIFEYLKGRGQIEMISIAQRPGNEHFAELIKRPLFLEMAVATADLIPDTVPVNDATLFDRYFESWYLRELSKLGPQTRTFSRLQAEEILTEAAYGMFVNGTAVISEEDFTEAVLRITGSNIRGELNNLKNQARNRLMLVPIELESRKVLTFKHEALKSYFLAVHFQLALMRQPPEFALPDNLDNVALGFFVTRISSSAESTRELSKVYEQGSRAALYGRDVMAAAFLLANLRNSPKVIDLATLRTFCNTAAEEVRNLVLAHLRQVDLTGMNLSGLNLKGAMLQKARLEGVNFFGTDLTSARLDGADLTQAGFEASKLDYTSFKYAVLERARLVKVNSTGTKFQKAILANAALQDCAFIRADFSGCRLEAARLKHNSFTDCHFQGATLNNLVVCERSSWLECDLTGAGFQGSTCIQCSFEGSNIDGAIGLNLSQEATGS